MARVRICTCESRNATPTQPQPVSRMHLINHYRQFWVPCELAKHAEVACNSNSNITDSAVESNTLLLPHFNNNHNSSPAWAVFTQPRRSLDDLATHGPASTATLFIRPFWLDRPDSFIFHFCCVRLSFTAHHRSIPLLRYYLITLLHSCLFCPSLLRLINYLGGLFCSEKGFWELYH